MKQSSSHDEINVLHHAITSNTEHFYELAGDFALEVEFVVTRKEADRFIAEVGDRGSSLFYLRVPIDFGFISVGKP